MTSSASEQEQERRAVAAHDRVLPGAEQSVEAERERHAAREQHHRDLAHHDLAVDGERLDERGQPSSKPMFAMFEPTTLPNVIAELPENVANSATASSGALVPNATVVRPMMIGDTPGRCASAATLYSRVFRRRTEAMMNGRLLPWLLPALLGATASAQTTFANANHAAAPAPAAVAAADLDFDADTDLATAHPAADLVVANRNLAAGTAWASSTLFTYAAGSQPQELVVAQLDGGGRPDVAVVLQGLDQVSIHLASGAWPGFGTPQVVGVGGAPIEAVAFDLDSDGDRDLAVLCQSPAEVHLLRNTGGVFANAGAVALSILPHAIGAGQLNADGPADLVVTGSFGTAFADVLLNQSTTTTVAFLPEQMFPVGGRPYGVCTGDLNGDGFADIATSNTASSTATVLLNDASVLTATTVAFLGTDYPLAPGAISGPGTEVECADLDCDGDADLACATNLTGDVAFLWNDGAGTMSAAWMEPTPFDDVDLVIADFSGDGHADVATANRGTGDVTVLLNELSVTCCRHVFFGGIIDGYDLTQPNGVEDACPGPELLAYYSGPRRDFDGPVACNLPFLHSFAGLPERIKTAVLYLGARADCTSPGDTLRLGLDAATGTFAFSGPVGVLAANPPWTAGTTAGVSLVLSDLPGGVNLLAKVAADGRLDILIGDDTAVEFCYLEIQTCERRARADMGLGATPYVTPGIWTWTVTGGPSSSIGFLFLSTAVGPGPLIGDGFLCVQSPSFLSAFPIDAGGSGSLSLPIPFPLSAPCFTFAAQALAFESSGPTFAYSNTVTQQIFD